MSNFTASMVSPAPRNTRAACMGARPAHVLPYRRAGRTPAAGPSTGGRQRTEAERDEARRRNRLVALANAQARLENAMRDSLRNDAGRTSHE